MQGSMILQAEKLDILKREIKELEAHTTKSFLELGKRWKQIRDEKLWKCSALKLKSFRDFCERECKRSRAMVYYLISIYEKFGHLLEHQPSHNLEFEYTRLIKLLPKTNTENAEQFLEIARTTSKKDFEKYLKDLNKTKKVKKVEYGEPINFMGLRHAPINEQGVVYLFGMLSKQLGFIIEAVRTAFPDCEGKRQIPGKQNKWERVSIEFEYKSLQFKEHDHDLDGCDVIICWENDWLDCPIEVIALKEYIGKK